MSSFRHSRIIALTTLSICLLTAAPPLAAQTPNYSVAARRLDVDFVARLRAIGAAHRAGNPVKHLQATMSLLTLMNDTSIRALLPETDRLVNSINADGAAPYSSISIELGYRLARLNQDATQRQFAKLAKAVLLPANNPPLVAQSRMVALIRGEPGPAYKQADDRTARAVSRLFFTEFGRSQVLAGQTPADTSRTVAMLWDCQATSTTEIPRTIESKRLCQQFTDIVGDRLRQAGQSGVLPGIQTDLQGGTQLQTFDCLDGERGFNQMIESLETYTACIANQMSNHSGWGVDGSSVSSDWSGTPPSFPGWEHKRSTESVHYGPNGNTGTQVTHEYTNSSGGTMTVSDYSVIVDGQETNGTHMQTNDGHGNTHEEIRNDQGETVFAYDEHGNGTTSSFQRNDDGSSTEVTTDNNTGKSHVKHTDEDGNVTEADIKENGECTGAACSAASTSVDDMGNTSGCSLNPDPRKQQDFTTVDPLGPYIYPSPDSVGSTNPLLACVISSLPTSGTRRCPPSVVLCVEPPPLGSCSCVVPRRGTPFGDYASAQCARIQCAEGSCDPKTGTCRSRGANSGLGRLTPGTNPGPKPWIRNPLPIPGPGVPGTPTRPGTTPGTS
jgi:hypothetical protein